MESTINKEEKQNTENIALKNKDEQMPEFDASEEWVKHFIEQFGRNPSFF